MLSMHDITKRVVNNMENKGNKVTIKQTREVIDSLLDCIVQALHESESVHLTGFGKFEVEHIPACKKYNPTFDDMIDIPEYDKIAFRFSECLKNEFKPLKRKM